MNSETNDNKTEGNDIDIITDVDILRKASKAININDEEEVAIVVKTMVDQFSKDDLGLAGPQIGMQKCVFIAKIKNIPHVYINPTIVSVSKDMCPSEEACLSLPKVSRCINRHRHIKVLSSIVYRVNNDKTYERIENKELVLVGNDAVVFQHENDHLNGILIIDHDEVPTAMQRIMARNKLKSEKMQKRGTKVKKKNELQPMNKKRQKKVLDAMHKKARGQRRAIRISEEKKFDAETEVTKIK